MDEEGEGGRQGGRDGEVGGDEGAVPPSICTFQYLYEELFNSTPVQNLLQNYVNCHMVLSISHD